MFLADVFAASFVIQLRVELQHGVELFRNEVFVVQNFNPVVLADFKIAGIDAFVGFLAVNHGKRLFEARQKLVLVKFKQIAVAFFLHQKFLEFDERFLIGFFTPDVFRRARKHPLLENRKQSFLGIEKCYFPRHAPGIAAILFDSLEISFICSAGYAAYEVSPLFKNFLRSRAVSFFPSVFVVR